MEADSRLETNRKQRKIKLEELNAPGKAYANALEEARAHYSDYQKTIKACLFQDVATLALIALLAPELEVAGVAGMDPAVVEQANAAIELAEQQGLFPPMGLQQIAKIVDKIIKGEDPTTAIAPEGVQVWDESFAAIQKVETLFSDTTTVSGMEKSIEECQGSFLVSAETKLSADKCVEGFKAALDSLAEFHMVENDIRDLDTELPNLQYDAWAACVVRARCEGTPESDCDGKKPEGDWPPVP